MKFIAERERILSALSFVGRYAETNERIPVLSMVRFEAGEHGVSVMATDLQKAASDSFIAHLDRKGSACLSGSLLVKAIKSTDATEVLIDAGDTEASIMIGGRLKMKLPVLPATDFPTPSSLTSDADHNFTVSPDLLARHANEVAFAETGRGERDRWYLQGTCWEAQEKHLRLCATNGKILSLLTLPAPSSDLFRIIVPSIDLPEWKDDISVAVSERFIRFTCGKQTVATQIIEGSFPDFLRAIPENPIKLLFDRAELLAAVERMALVGQGRGAVILFVGRDGKATLSAYVDGREITDEVPYEGDDFQVAIAHQYISSVLGSFGSEIVEWRVADHSTPITVHDPRNDDRIAVAFPCRDHRISQYLPAVLEAAE